LGDVGEVVAYTKYNDKDDYEFDES